MTTFKDWIAKRAWFFTGVMAWVVGIIILETGHEGELIAFSSGLVLGMIMMILTIKDGRKVIERLDSEAMRARDNE